MRFHLSDWFNVHRKIMHDPSDISELRLIINQVIAETDIERTISKHSKYFRARIIKEDDEPEVNYNKDNSGFYGFNERGSSAPPPESAIYGRANKNGESVLYLAEDMYTALAEVRSGKRQRISIAEVEIKDDLKIVSLCFSEDPAMAKEIYYWIAFSFFIPINNTESDYFVTQCIAKCLKECGYNGIEYSSSLSASGKNLVVFDPYKAQPVNSKIYQTVQILYYAEEQLPRLNNERLIPKSITDKFSRSEIDWFLGLF